MKKLLEKYRRGKISPVELENLTRKVNASSDEEIARILEKEWMNEGSSNRRIKKTRLWTSIAACILLLVTTGLSLRIVHINKEQKLLASREMRIDAGNEGKSQIILPDGTKVILNAKSTIEYPADFGVKNRCVKLSGQGYFDVTKDASHEFIVSAQGMDVIVHGTKFNVYAYPDNFLKEVSLIEGSISLRYGDSEVRLSPNEKACIRTDSGRLNLFKTDNSVETSWLDESITFINKPLHQVIDILQRHFGVIIECSSNINLADRYTGSFNESRVEDIIDILKMHYGFNYESRDNRIFINNK